MMVLVRIPWFIVSIVAIVVLAVGVGAMLLRRILRKSSSMQAGQLGMRRIDLSSLSDAGPSEEGVRLEFYHVPVRLALVVLAPVGREGRLPESDQLPGLIDQIVPGLMDVLASHQPQFHRWPPQLSSEGFINAFFSHLCLPGDRGRGTPWCSIAGRFETDAHSYLVGMVCCAAQRNSLGQIEVKHAGQWLDILRVRHPSAPG